MGRRQASESGWRGSAAASVMLGCLDTIDAGARALVVDDPDGDLQRALAASGVETAAWDRFHVSAHEARPWPPAGPFDSALVRLPKGREAQEMTLHAVASVLVPSVRLFVFGTNDEGIRSLGKKIEGLLGPAHTLDARRHSRVIAAVRPATVEGLKGQLTDWRHCWRLVLAGGEREWVSYPGLFAHGRLDEGTAQLLDGLPAIAPGGRVLDFGCGTGVIGAAVLARQPQAEVDLMDVDALALQAAAENVPGARVVPGGDLSALGERRYHAILSNPPFHTGKGEDLAILRRLIEQAPAHLEPHGCLQIVVQARLAVGDLLQARFRRVEALSESSRFRVWRAA